LILGNSRPAIRHVGPGAAAVARDLEVAVVGAESKDLAGDRRFREGGDGAVPCDSVTEPQGVFRRFLAEDGKRFAVDRLGQVVAQPGPKFTMIG
jgi:hypothetical protein